MTSLSKRKTRSFQGITIVDFQQDSIADRWNTRWEHWPLHHHHGLPWIYSLLRTEQYYFLLIFIPYLPSDIFSVPYNFCFHLTCKSFDEIYVEGQNRNFLVGLILAYRELNFYIGQQKCRLQGAHRQASNV